MANHSDNYTNKALELVIKAGVPIDGDVFDQDVLGGNVGGRLNHNAIFGAGKDGIMSKLQAIESSIKGFDKQNDDEKEGLRGPIMQGLAEARENLVQLNEAFETLRNLVGEKLGDNEKRRVKDVEKLGA